MKFHDRESPKMLQKVYGEWTLSKTYASEQYKTFKNGRDKMEDMPRFGGPSTSLNELEI